MIVLLKEGEVALIQDGNNNVEKTRQPRISQGNTTRLHNYGSLCPEPPNYLCLAAGIKKGFILNAMNLEP